MKHLNIALFDGDKDILELLKEILEDVGYTVITGLVADIVSGKLDISDFMKSFHPNIVIYDIIPPFNKNIDFLDYLRTTLAFKDQCIIVTSSNKKLLEKETAERLSIEIIEKPYDLEGILSAIDRRMAECSEAA